VAEAVIADRMGRRRLPRPWTLKSVPDISLQYLSTLCKFMPKRIAAEVKNHEDINKKNRSSLKSQKYGTFYFGAFLGSKSTLPYFSGVFLTEVFDIGG
jgi:hypothetical protein